MFLDIHCHGNLSNSPYAIWLIISKKFKNLNTDNKSYSNSFMYINLFEKLYIFFRFVHFILLEIISAVIETETIKIFNAPYNFRTGLYRSFATDNRNLDKIMK